MPDNIRKIILVILFLVLIALATYLGLWVVGGGSV